MKTILNNKELLDDCFTFLWDLRHAGVYNVYDMLNSLETRFFLKDYESQLILMEWIRYAQAGDIPDESH